MTDHDDFELQRTQTEITDAQQASVDAAADALRYRVAYDHGLTVADADLLGTGNREQLEARAARIKHLAGIDPPETPNTGGQRMPDSVEQRAEIYRRHLGGQHMHPSRNR